MKKILSMIALALALMLCVCACAETIKPVRTIDMAGELKNMKFNTILCDRTIGDNCLYADVYDVVRYSADEVEKLAVGDVIETEDGKQVEIKKIDAGEYATDINGGNCEEGITLCREDKEPYFDFMDYETPQIIILGQAQLMYADTVKINIYKMNDDFSIREEGYDTFELSGADITAKLKEIAGKFGGEVGPREVTVTIGDDEAVLTEVTVDYMP